MKCLFVAAILGSLFGSIGCKEKTLPPKKLPAGKLLTENLDGSHTYWVTKAPTNIDKDRLTSVVRRASETNSLYALLVIQDGHIVVERYFRGCDSESLFQIRSITKSFTSAILGSMIGDGTIESVNVPIGKLINGTDSEKQNIPLVHFLTMSAGFQWNEDEELLRLMSRDQKDPVGYLFERDIVSRPGIEFEYNTLCSQTLAQVMESKSGKRLETLAEERLFSPLDIKSYQWETNADDKAWGGMGLQLTARDLAKFGLLFLNHGKWDGKQVISQEWVRDSVKRHVDTELPEEGYGYHWWNSKNPAYEKEIFFGVGYGGQMLIVIPHKNMIVVGLQPYMVSLQQDQKQVGDFINTILIPLYQSIN